MDLKVVSNQALLSSAVQSLSRPQKTLDSKWFYDTRGSELFEDITKLPEYYPTRTEIAILRDNVQALAGIVPEGATLVEIGSGASVKTRILLDAITHLKGYAPLDISADFLQYTVDKLTSAYPDLAIHPVAADFMQDIVLPSELADEELVAFFPGSTIGNLTEDAALALLERIRRMGNVKALILGADLVKDPTTLVAAYDDAARVTADFNRNLLVRLNRETGAYFDLDAFDHVAIWNAESARIEMHLVSRVAQTVRIDGRTFSFAEGETIHTENSHKYTRDRVGQMAEKSGWQVSKWITDKDELFSVSVLTS